LGRDYAGLIFLYGNQFLVMDVKVSSENRLDQIDFDEFGRRRRKFYETLTEESARSVCLCCAPGSTQPIEFSSWGILARLAHVRQYSTLLF
jgi:hypothetical protein